jgi:putative transposase
MRKIKFVNDYFYHIYNRGVEKRDIFLEKVDYFRFIHDLYEFNDTQSVFNSARKIVRGSTSNNLSDKTRRRDLLVEIIAFCLMPNHFHFILCQKKDDGIVKFMQKIGTGYTIYFNQKNKRSGVLFQGKFKATLVDTDKYFLPLINYIHLNPVELIEPGWKENGIKNRQAINKFLENYRWSSYPDYIGIKNFPSILDKKFVESYFNKEIDYKKFINQQLIKKFELTESVDLDFN